MCGECQRDEFGESLPVVFEEGGAIFWGNFKPVLTAGMIWLRRKFGDR
jgi:hypothetical protein